MTTRRVAHALATVSKSIRVRQSATHAATVVVTAIVAYFLLTLVDPATPDVLGQSVSPIGPRPETPTRFFGSVLLNGQPAPSGTVVRGLINGRECATSSVQGSGNYVMDIPAATRSPGCGTAGARVSFTVGGAPANETGTFQHGAFIQVNLTAYNSSPTLPPASSPQTVSLSITVDRAEYFVDDPQTVCLTTSRPVAVRLTNFVDGSQQAVVDVGVISGQQCATGNIGRPLGDEVLRAEAIENGRVIASAEARYRGRERTRTCPNGFVTPATEQCPPPPAASPPPSVPAPPPSRKPPTRFYGTIRIGGRPAPRDTTVRTFVNGRDCTDKVEMFHSPDADYVVDVSDGSVIGGCGTDGAVVTFRVNGIDANERGIFHSGQFLKLDLTLSSDVPSPSCVVGPNGTCTATPVRCGQRFTAPWREQRWVVDLGEQQEGVLMLDLGTNPGPRVSGTVRVFRGRDLLAVFVPGLGEQATAFARLNREPITIETDAGPDGFELVLTCVTEGDTCSSPSGDGDNSLQLFPVGTDYWIIARWKGLQDDTLRRISEALGLIDDRFLPWLGRDAVDSDDEFELHAAHAWRGDSEIVVVGVISTVELFHDVQPDRSGRRAVTVHMRGDRDLFDLKTCTVPVVSTY